MQIWVDMWSFARTWQGSFSVTQFAFKFQSSIATSPPVWIKLYFYQIQTFIFLEYNLRISND